MSGHDKHRERFDKKVRENGLEKLEPHEQLEYILYNVIPRRNTNDIAHQLLDKYKTIMGVLTADPEELKEIDGIGSRCAMFLTTLPAIAGIFERCKKENEQIFLDDTKTIVEYAKTYFYGKLNEEVYLFSFNTTNRLIAVSQVSQGAPDEAYVYPAQVVRQAIRDKACSIVLVHNHPGGESKPSSGDVTLSRNLARAFDPIEIVFKDSLIIAGEEYFSMREKGYLDNLYEKNYRFDRR